MSNEELINKLVFISKNPESIPLEKLIYIISLLRMAVIDSFWDGKISYEKMESILYAGEE